MSSVEKYDVIVFDAGTAGKVMALNMAKAGRRTPVVERKYIGGCPNVACLPSKNIIYSAKAASLVARHREIGIETGPNVHRHGGVTKTNLNGYAGFCRGRLPRGRIRGAIC